MAHVSDGDIVHVHYTGRFEDGTVFDSSQGGEPLEFVAGGKDIIEGVSRGVVGMGMGEKKTLTIPPEQGYGDRDPGLSRTVPLNALPDGIAVGDRVAATAGEQRVIFWVTSIEGTEAVIDANHPLAGRTLVFDLEIAGIFDEPQQDHGHHHGGDECGCGEEH